MSHTGRERLGTRSQLVISTLTYYRLRKTYLDRWMPSPWRLGLTLLIGPGLRATLQPPGICIKNCCRLWKKFSGPRMKLPSSHGPSWQISPDILEMRQRLGDYTPTPET